MFIFSVFFLYASIFQCILFSSFHVGLFNEQKMCYNNYVLLWTYYIFIYFHDENMDSLHAVNKSNINGRDICLANSATTHTILRHMQYFSNMRMMKAKVNTIWGSTYFIEGSRRANVMLHNETRFIIDNALFSTKSRRNLLSFKDIRLNGYHIETANNNDIEYLYIVSNVSTK